MFVGEVVLFWRGGRSCAGCGGGGGGGGGGEFEGGLQVLLRLPEAEIVVSCRRNGWSGGRYSCLASCSSRYTR